MNIRQERNQDTVILTLEGSLDAVHAPIFEATCREFLDSCPKYVLLDGTRWDFVGEAGLHALLMLLKALKGRATVALIHPMPLIRQIFDISGFSESFEYYDTIEAAKRAFKERQQL